MAPMGPSFCLVLGETITKLCDSCAIVLPKTRALMAYCSSLYSRSTSTAEVSAKAIRTCAHPPPLEKVLFYRKNSPLNYLIYSNIQQTPPLKGVSTLAVVAVTAVMLLHACASFACCLGAIARVCACVCVCVL